MPTLADKIRYGDDVSIVTIDTSGNVNISPNFDANIYGIAIAPDSDVDIATVIHQDIVGNWLNSTFSVGSPYLGKMEAIAKNSSRLISVQYQGLASPRYFQDAAISTWFQGGGAQSTYSWDPDQTTQLPQLKLMVFQRKPRNLLPFQRLNKTISKTFIGTSPGVTTTYFRLPTWGRKTFSYQYAAIAGQGSSVVPSNTINGDNILYGIIFNRSGSGALDFIKVPLTITSGGNLSRENIDAWEFDAIQVDILSTTTISVGVMWKVQVCD